MRETHRSYWNWDLAIAALITVSTLLSLFRLGYAYAPVSSWQSEKTGEEIILDLGEELVISGLSWYVGNCAEQKFEVYVGKGEGNDSITWTWISDLDATWVWQWENHPLNGSGRFIKLVTAAQRSEINELLVKDAGGNPVLPVNASDYPALFDENYMYSGYGSFQSGTVFDETVFARTAYEYLHGLVSYEDTHPPLGKLLISAGIACFGMNPFGWRISGVVAGTSLLVVLWLFGKRLIKDSWVLTGVVALLALDFLRFGESRLGQVDSFLVLFMTAMYYFMYCYCEEAQKGQRGWRFLAGSGVCFGLAVSCKWSGFYGGAGLAVIWLILLIHRFRTGEIHWTDVGKICGVSAVFFVVFPAVIYLLSYIPYVPVDTSQGFFEKVIENQVNIWRFHSNVTSEHAMASRWYEWPLMLKPMELYSATYPDNHREMVTLMGNPGLWWPGATVLFISLYELTERIDGKRIFLMVGYAASLLPWIFISRCTFLYHYYPSVPFMALLIGVWVQGHGQKGRKFIVGCVIVSGILLVIFYPILSGIKIDQEYARCLEWLPGWNFTGK